MQQTQLPENLFCVVCPIRSILFISIEILNQLNVKINNLVVNYFLWVLLMLIVNCCKAHTSIFLGI